MNKGERDSVESKHLMTLTDVQEMLGIKSRKTLLKYINRGDLPAYKLGGTRWRVAFADVHRFVNAHRSK